jgi:hypothetical protein
MTEDQTANLKHLLRSGVTIEAIAASTGLPEPLVVDAIGRILVGGNAALELGGGTIRLME